MTDFKAGTFLQNTTSHVQRCSQAQSKWDVSILQLCPLHFRHILSYLLKGVFCVFLYTPSMNKKSLKDIWFYSNVCFFINYSLAILRAFVAFPLPRLPSFFNCVFLLLAYALTFQSIVANFKAYDTSTLIKKIFAHPNTFCIFLFLCFVPNVLLSPFYLLAVYHIVSSIVARKEAFHSYFFYDFVVFLNTNIATIGRSALLLEIVIIPVAVIMAILRRISMLTLSIYLLMIRQQYVSNNNMKAIVLECVQRAHGLAMQMPDSIKMKYLELVNYARSLNKSEKDQKQKQ